MNDIAGRDLSPENMPRVDVDPSPLEEMPKFETERTFKLGYQISRMNGQQIDAVTLRVPTALDLFEVGGMPSKTQWQQGGMSMEMDVQRLQDYIVRLSGLDKPDHLQAACQNRAQHVRLADAGVEQRGKLLKVVAFLAFEASFCNDDPSRLLRMPLRELMFWYNLAVGWRKLKNEAQAKASQQQQFRNRSFSR